ncbi:DUF6491 family protein [Dyella flagellata]|uniref:Lipoprotein n=1 Tax=Dyella flagellata TaxID=1867833 RepID=A0ABQ5XE12_9GAMM|nr:DUF6491 family protein [Dyella flagellata]GLQ89222.1 hypothetical protein GCM10007898_27940 [Dyella flagellata]
MSKLRILVLLLLGVLLVACESAPYAQRLQQRQQAYDAAAGAPVRSFRLIMGMQIYSWEPLSDTQLVIYTLPSKAYLLDVWPCNNLTFTNFIGLTSFAHEVQTGFDKVLTGRPYIPCVIKQIRPIDLTQLKLEKQGQRHIDSVPRDNSANAPASSGSSR